MADLSEIKKCQNCKKDFVIEPDDFSFYEKMKVPPPTQCSECRLIRRLGFRNERALYKRICNFCKKEVVSMYPESSPYLVYCPDCWWGDGWNAKDIWQEFDINRNFFEQFDELNLKVPKMALYQQANVNSPWVNRENNSKECYLNVGGIGNERSAYNSYAIWSKDSFDNHIILRGEIGCENVFCRNFYKNFFSTFCFDCQETYFSFNCRGCSNIIGCTNLRSKSYCIFNQQYTEEEYKKFLEDHDFGKYSETIYLKEKAKESELKYPHKFNFSSKAEGCVGDFIENSKNCKICFNCAETQNSKYAYAVWAKDSYDVSSVGPNNQFSYEFINGGMNTSNILFSTDCRESHDLYYCTDLLENCSNCFGCIGLRSKSYCILNKQYAKEEYQSLVEKIKKHMIDMPYVDRGGRTYGYGEFFPLELSPFTYNETVAQDYFSLTKEEALAKGYSWKDPEKKDYKVTKSPNELPDNIKDVDDTILKEVIGCAHEGRCLDQCTTAFKIIEPELQFYRKMNLPLPRFCPNCRHFERLNKKNPLKLWHRRCTCDKNHPQHEGRCPNEFETSYAPGRSEIIYCESCYQQEVV